MTAFEAAELTRDAFLGGRLTLWQPRHGYRAAIDPVFLAAFAPARPGQRVLDLGCGAGTAALCLGARVPGLELHGLEVQPAYVALARRNAAANAIAFSLYEGDLREPPTALRTQSFDLVIANPPYYPAGTPAAADPGRDRAQREAAVLPEWIAAGLRRLAPGGTLVLVHLAARLPELLAPLDGRAGAIEVLPLAARASRPADRVLLRARKGSRGPLKLHPPLVLHDGETHGGNAGCYSAAATSVLRGGAHLLQATP